MEHHWTQLQVGGRVEGRCVWGGGGVLPASAPSQQTPCWRPPAWPASRRASCCPPALAARVHQAAAQADSASCCIVLTCRVCVCPTQEVDYCDVFKAMHLKHEQNQDRVGPGKPAEGETPAAAAAREADLLARQRAAAAAEQRRRRECAAGAVARVGAGRAACRAPAPSRASLGPVIPITLDLLRRQGGGRAAPWSPPAGLPRVVPPPRLTRAAPPCFPPLPGGEREVDADEENYFDREGDSGGCWGGQGGMQVCGSGCSNAFAIQQRCGVGCR